MYGEGLNFEVLRTPERALAYLASSPLAFMDSLWVETHLPLLRVESVRVLALFDRVAASLQTQLQLRFSFSFAVGTA